MSVTSVQITYNLTIKNGLSVTMYAHGIEGVTYMIAYNDGNLQRMKGCQSVLDFAEFCNSVNQSCAVLYKYKVRDKRFDTFKVYYDGKVRVHRNSYYYISNIK